MFSTDDFYDTIKEHVGKLSLAWFNKKADDFKKERLYSSDKEIIYYVNIDSSPNYECDEEGEVYTVGHEEFEEVISVSLKQYCASYLPIEAITSWGSFPVDEYAANSKVTASNNIIEFAQDLILEISKFSKGITDNVALYKFISKVLDSIEGEIKTLKNISTNTTYSDVLTDFQKKCTSLIYRKYERELTFYHLTIDNTVTLDFSLNQDQLLALLFIIQRSGFLNYTDSSFLHFCSEHFRYKNKQGVYVKPKSVRDLQRKLSDVAASQVTNPTKTAIVNNGLNYVEEQLQKILDSLL